MTIIRTCSKLCSNANKLLQFFSTRETCTFLNVRPSRSLAHVKQEKRALHLPVPFLPISQSKAQTSSVVMRVVLIVLHTKAQSVLKDARPSCCHTAFVNLVVCNGEHYWQKLKLVRCSY